MAWGLWSIAAVLSGCAGGTPRSSPLAGPVRAVWVTRWDYRTESDVRRIVAACARSGFSRILFQVRGNGTTYWRSRSEVWSEAFGHRDPGFDPLGVALAAARSRGLELHAWVNAMPGWRGAQPPRDRRQLWHARPGWFLRDAEGKREPLAASRYQCLNPCLPEVRAYVAELLGQLAARYDVDGVHLDYIRFVTGDYAGGEQFGRDAQTRALFADATGRDAIAEPGAFAAWQTGCVTEMVAGIRRAVREARRGCQLSAAVFAKIDAARRLRQNWPDWARRGLVDALYPMNYETDDTAFSVRTEAAVAAAAGVPIVVGIGAHKHAGATQTVGQIDAALERRVAGYSLFAYKVVVAGDAATRRAITARNSALDGLHRRR